MWGERISIKSVCLGADCFAFGELLDKAPSNQGLVLLVGSLLRRGSFTPVSLRGPCVQPAPKSRLAVFEHFVYENQKQIKSFPAEAGPTVCTHCF